MNFQFNQGPLQQMQLLLNKLSNYIYQVNSIITEMNNLFIQINNPLINPMNFNLNPMSNNDIMNLDLNNFMMNLEKIQDNKPKVNACFRVNDCNYEIMKFSSNPGQIINIAIDPDKSINDLLIEFYKRIGKGNNINEIKDKFIFFYLGNKLDFNDKKTIKNLLNIKGELSETKLFNIYVKQIF